MTPTERRNSLIVILVSITVSGVCWGLSFPLLALLMEDMGVSRTIIGLNTAVAAIATLVFVPFSPILMGTIGLKRTLTASMILAIVSVLAINVWHNVWFWFVLRFTLGVALAGLFVATEVWINSAAQERTRGRILGLYATGLSGGFALGVGILSLQGTDGWLPFLTAAAIQFFALVLLLTLRVKIPDFKSRAYVPLRPFMLLAPTALAAALVFGAVEMGILSLLPVYGERAGMSEAMAVQMLMAAALGNVALQLPVGWLADHMNRRTVLALCAFSGIVGAVAIPFTLSVPWLLFTVLFITGGVIVGLYTVGLTLIGERFQGADLAGANAAFVFMYGLGSLFGPSLSGAAMDLWDPHGLMVVLGGVCLAYLGLVVIRAARKKQGRS